MAAITKPASRAIPLHNEYLQDIHAIVIRSKHVNSFFQADADNINNPNPDYNKSYVIGSSTVNATVANSTKTKCTEILNEYKNQCDDMYNNPCISTVNPNINDPVHLKNQLRTQSNKYRTCANLRKLYSAYNNCTAPNPAVDASHAYASDVFKLNADECKELGTNPSLFLYKYIINELDNNFVYNRLGLNIDPYRLNYTTNIAARNPANVYRPGFYTTLQIDTRITGILIELFTKANQFFNQHQTQNPARALTKATKEYIIYNYRLYTRIINYIITYIYIINLIQTDQTIQTLVLNFLSIDNYATAFMQGFYGGIDSVRINQFDVLRYEQNIFTIKTDILANKKVLSNRLGKRIKKSRKRSNKRNSKRKQ